MNNRNATASWSGYSHQGQVGLLIALRKMQETHIDLDSHFLEYEIREDVAIYKRDNDGNKEYLSVHQVKAYYSANNNTKAKYDSVLNNTFETCGQDFLHVVVDVTDWDTSTISNKNSINRFNYAPNVFHCDTTEIEKFIKAELRNILGDNDGQITSALYRLTYRLDCKIRKEHKKIHKHLFDISFSLQEVKDQVWDTSDFQATNIYKVRKDFYELYCEEVKNSDYEDEHLKRINETIIDPIYSLSDEDFLTFLQRLNFDEKPERLKSTHYIFNQHGLRYVFFKSLMEILLVLPKEEEKFVKYQKIGKPEKYIVTTITRRQQNSSSVVENIIKNTDSQNILWDNHSLINDAISGTITELNPNIMNVPSGDRGENKFMSYTSSNRLVTVEEAKKILNND